MNIRKNLSNILGWSTKRKIVVIESDDWGSIRTRSKADYDSMLQKGLNVDKNYFTKYDSLESNRDLENLFTTLDEFKDSTGRHPVFTSMCIVANPDFKKITESNFSKYYYKKLSDTIREYPAHDKLIDYWIDGSKNRYFVPSLHGREHLNVRRFIEGVNDQNNLGVKIAYDHGSFGASSWNDSKLIEHCGAFHPETVEEIQELCSIIDDGCNIFEELIGSKPKHFIAPNREGAIEIDAILAKNGISYLTQSKLRKYPKGNDNYGFEFNWWGKTNKYGQIYLMRNCAFEPSNPKVENYADKCLVEIENAFKWKKPAIISSHRVNYNGFIDSKNADYGLLKLRYLLTQIIKKWPDVEFMTSSEVGELIEESRKLCEN